MLSLLGSLVRPPTAVQRPPQAKETLSSWELGVQGQWRGERVQN